MIRLEKQVYDWSTNYTSNIKDGDNKVTAVMPDWNHAGVYWFTTRGGKIGIVSRRTVNQAELPYLSYPKEEIQKLLCGRPDGTFVVTDRALYNW